jgi:hypothetical protein
MCEEFSKHDMETSGIVPLSFEIEGRGQEASDQSGRSDVASFAKPWLVPVRVLRAPRRR